MNIKKTFNWILRIAIGIFLLILSVVIYIELDSDFRLENIVYDNISSASYLDVSDDLQKILNHSFTYLGKGHQAFVFESDDGKYVIKFFRFWRLKPSKVMKALGYIPFLKPTYDHYEKKRLRRLEKLFLGYEVAYQYDKENTGLLFLHLHQTNELNKILKVKDRFGFHHFINLDEVCFAVQKRGISTKKILNELLGNNEIEKCKVILRQLIDLYLSEYRNGIIDQDHNVLDNTGFSQEGPFRLDIGQLKKDESIQIRENYLKDLRKIIDKRLLVWLRKHFPTVAEELIQDLESKWISIQSY